MHYIIQENVFREEHYDFLWKTLDRMGLTYTTVRIFPFIDKIVDVSVIPDTPYEVSDLPDFIPESSNVFVFGAIKLARIVKNKGWAPGSMMNENHDFLVYREYFKDNLLNYDSAIYKISEKIKWNKSEIKFIRPTKDTKAFTGKVFSEDGWNRLVDRYMKTFKSDVFNENTEIQISKPKHIQKEIRFWVVNGKIVTGSIYRLGNSVIYDEFYDPEAEEFAQSMVNIFKLADSFVIDVCLVDDKWKIVECGCTNCAGFYKANLSKLINALEEHFSS